MMTVSLRLRRGNISTTVIRILSNRARARPLSFPRPRPAATAEAMPLRKFRSKRRRNRRERKRTLSPIGPGSSGPSRTRRATCSFFRLKGLQCCKQFRHRPNNEMSVGRSILQLPLFSCGEIACCIAISHPPLRRITPGCQAHTQDRIEWRHRAISAGRDRVSNRARKCGDPTPKARMFSFKICIVLDRDRLQRCSLFHYVAIYTGCSRREPAPCSRDLFPPGTQNLTGKRVLES